MSQTAYHAKFYAHELTKRSSSDSVDKLASALSDAQVDLNPHQIEAALFAFRSPLSKGAILADEVGLGKTIEAGILLAQNWAERRRTLLVICPANLRKQWSQELLDKFFLPSVILETKTFNEAIRAGNLNPFQQPKIIICSFQFARSKEPYLRSTAWNLVVIDEAHRLRNVYKPGNKVANSIKNAVSGFQKVLLTATPLQNSLLELYGLVSIVDEFTFGDLRSFRAQFARLSGKADFDALKQRLRPICQRTLRRQVLAYVPYTNRHAMVQEFSPTAAEQQLYELVSDYLKGEKLYALPASQRQLMTLILRKLLASSTYAISNTLLGLANKLEAAEADQQKAAEVPADLAEDFETLPEVQEEWVDDDEGAESDAKDENVKKQSDRLPPEQLAELRAEKEKLRQFHALAKAVQVNSKGEVLLTALQRGFEVARTVRMENGTGALQQKAIIFTESRRTQEYLFNLLQKTEFAGKVVLFNGTNTDPLSQAIYQRWMKQHAGTDRITGSPTADKRAALVENFRDGSSIMIATEAAAEGINLQFCNLVVNYDMPWNPQRIEQRIGRCHRYGQKYDVVVVNFLNKANAADVRVYQLLAEKFKLFDGVFGASDEVIGAIESGVEFEKRIVAIYQQCRTTEQIEFQFDQLQQELESQIAQARSDASEQLLNNFDQEVIERVRLSSGNSLSRFEDLLWRVTAALCTAAHLCLSCPRRWGHFKEKRHNMTNTATLAEAVYRHDHDHPSALDVFLACTLPLAEKSARRRAHKIFIYPTDWQVELMYDGAVTAAIAVFQCNSVIESGSDAFRRYLYRALALGTVRSYFRREEYDGIFTVADFATVPTRKGPFRNQSEQEIITRDLLNQVTGFPNLRPHVCATLQCIRALGPDEALKEHAHTESGDPDKWKRERGRRPILNPNAIAKAMGTDRYTVHTNLREARIILRSVFNADGKLFLSH